MRINEARTRDTGLKDEMDALKEQSKKAKDKQRDIMVRVHVLCGRRCSAD